MSKLSRHFGAAIAAVAALTFITSCNPQRQAVSSAGESTATAQVTTASVFETLVGSYSPEWTALRVPFTLRLTAPSDFTVSGTATMARDRSVLMSFRMLGFEVAALQVTGDSLTVVEKMNRQYLTVPVAKALGGFDACVANIQDLLTGRAFILGADSITTAMAPAFRIGSTDDGRAWILEPKKQPRGAGYAFTLTPSGRLTRLTVTPDSYPEGSAAYPSQADTPRGVMASGISISAEVNGKPVKAEIEWDWRKARFDTDVDVRPLAIGRNYKPIDLGSLIKKLPVNSSTTGK